MVMKTKDQIIYDMCMTTDHSFGLPTSMDVGGMFGSFSLTQADKDHIRRNMAQLFDHHIQPIFDELQILTEESEKVKTKLGETFRKIEEQKEIIQKQKETIVELKRKMGNESKLDLRMKELAALPDGWLNGEGSRLNKDGLARFAKEFDKSLPLPHLYPSVSGNLWAEWTFGDYEVSLDVDLQTLSAEYQSVSIMGDTDLSTERTIDLSAPAGWFRLRELLKELMDK
jgi:hypothetical protein